MALLAWVAPGRALAMRGAPQRSRTTSTSSSSALLFHRDEPRLVDPRVPRVSIQRAEEVRRCPRPNVMEPVVKSLNRKAPLPSVELRKESLPHPWIKAAEACKVDVLPEISR